MIGFARILGVAIFLAAVGVSPAADPKTSDAKPVPTAEELVRDLASPSFSVRDKAAKELWKRGEDARKALEAGALSEDQEVAKVCTEILDKFERGIYPDTPPAVAKLIGEYRTGALEKQKAAIDGLLKIGERGYPALRAQFRTELPAETRNSVFEHLAIALRREVPRVIVAGDLETAERMLALNAMGTWTAGLIDYATFLHLRGTAKAAIPALEAQRKSGGHLGTAAGQALIFVHRAAGDSKKARVLAAELSAADPADPFLRAIYDSLLEDLGGWDDLVERTEDGPANSHDGLRMFRLRLAGKPKDADEIGDRVKDEDPAAGRSYGVDSGTTALMLNGRELDGISRMGEKKHLPHILADVLAARFDFATALDKVGSGLDKANENEGELPFKVLTIQYGARKGKLLAQLGKREAAQQVFAALAGKIETPQEESQFYQIVRAEVRVGLHDLAAEHLGEFLARTGRDAREGQFAGSQNPFEALFDADAEAAQFWWKTLGKNRTDAEKPGRTMLRVRRLLTGKATADELADAIKLAGQDAIDPGSPAGFARAVALAAVYRAARRPDDAIAELAKVADKLATPAAPAVGLEPDDESPRFGRGARSWVFGTDERVMLWIDLGDMLFDQNRPRAAAERYYQGWQEFPENPLPLYLSGRALMMAGDEKEGKRRVDASHLVGLGNARVRGRFLEELLARGPLSEVRRERDIVRECAWVSELYVGNVWNQVGRASLALKDYEGAADATRRAIHYLLRTPGVGYVEGYAYLTVPQAVRVHTARAALAAGKTADSLTLAKDCLTILPGNTDVAIGMVPELDKLGKKAEADALFRQVWDVYAKLIVDYPDSAWARNSAAWLAAGCRRELDAALKHAEKAVDLDRNSNAYQETLAEVRFRRGERDAAVAIARKLVAAEPRNHHFRRQLERFSTAAFDSPLPETADD